MRDILVLTKFIDPNNLSDLKRVWLKHLTNSSMASNDGKIPTIDLCKPDLKPGTTQWDSTKTEVLQALQEYGCFLAKYDKVPNEIREAMFGASKEIFELPLETKLKLVGKNKFHGYVGPNPCESVAVVDLLQHESFETFCNLYWPDGNSDFCNICKSYSKPLVELDEIIKMMVLESLGLKNYIDEFLDGTNFCYLRFTHYKAPQSEDGNKSGLPDHTDGGFLNIIMQNQVNGLQVLKKNGECIDVNIAPNTYFVISGDTFMAWTNSRVHSPVHRVMMGGEDDRFSFQFSSAPKSGYIIKAPKELVDEEHPLLFKPFELLEMLENAVSAGSKTGAFKAYFGV